MKRKYLYVTTGIKLEQSKTIYLKNTRSTKNAKRLYLNDNEKVKYISLISARLANKIIRTYVILVRIIIEITKKPDFCI